jgi:type II secretory ATPase GspE/PulE/Tfp pilus assembly ATPase PilB-like protein
LTIDSQIIRLLKKINKRNYKMEENKSSVMGSIVHITDESQLPVGKLISYAKDPLELSERLRREMVIWDISTEARKMIWILCLKTSYNSVSFMQTVKNAENQGYKIVKKGVIDYNILNALYDRRNFNENQKATGDDSEVVALFETILADALLESISDIHIEVRTNGGTVRMRKNGEMTIYNADSRLTYMESNNLCSVMYNVLASTKSVSFDPRECQQAAVNYSIGEQELKLRYQSVPAYPDGYDVILRVLPVGRSEEFTPLQKLGYTDQQVKELLNISSRPVGSLIIAGVTGSGKSTTMKNLLMYINADAGYRLKIYSIEDPPEYNIAKITQIPVVIGKDFDPTKMSPFEKPIKACMRGDPDIIMIGEVRDKTTGDLTKKAVQSGHQVLTTVHATSALGIIDRFIDFGLTRSVLGSPDFLTGLLYQKLMPVTCKNCAINFNELISSGRGTQDDMELFERMMSVCDVTQYSIQMRNKNGCEQCKYSGIKGRSVCAEVVMVDLDMIQLIGEGKTIELMKYWRSLSDKDPFSLNMRGKTCMEHAFQKCLAGIVCPHDVEGSFRPLNEMLMERKKKEENKIEEKSGDKNQKDDWVNL